ncbi:hypothetical protein HK101_005248 [Irineochytrium annulatum]|nr:hypothetical protein HK101_005248 [Irineochytrium annulatum]
MVGEKAVAIGSERLPETGIIGRENETGTGTGTETVLGRATGNANASVNESGSGKDEEIARKDKKFTREEVEKST